MKTKIYSLLLALVALALAYVSLNTSAQVATQIYGTINQPVINTATFLQTTITNGSVITTNYTGSKGVSTWPWTNSITGDYTNLTALEANNSGHHLSVQVSLQQQLTFTNATVVPTNILIRLARNVQGYSGVNTTNGVTGPMGVLNNGLPLPFEVFAQLTNATTQITVAQATTAGLGGVTPTSTTVYELDDNPAAVAVGNVDQLIPGTWTDGAVPYLYVLDVTTPSGVIVTNLSVFIQQN